MDKLIYKFWMKTEMKNKSLNMYAYKCITTLKIYRNAGNKEVIF